MTTKPVPKITKPSEKAPTRTPIGEIKAKDVWCMVCGEYVQDWEPRSPKIFQTGLLKDESGQIKVTIFKNDGETQHKMLEGTTYRLWSVVTDEYPAGSGKFSLKVNRKTIIEEIDA